MAALFDAEEMLAVTKGRLAVGMMPEGAGAVVADSRKIKAGDWFVCLVGQNFDGHDFLGDAFAQEAMGCLVEERSFYPIAATTFPLIAVDNTEEALGRLVLNWRRRLRRKLILRFSETAPWGNTAGLNCESGPEAVLKSLSEALPESAKSEALLGFYEQLESRAGAKNLSSVLLNWKKNVSEIMVDFLAVDEEIDILVADFAPRPLSRLLWLLRYLRPDAVILSPQAFSFETGLSFEQVKRDFLTPAAAVLAEWAGKAIALSAHEELTDLNLDLPEVLFSRLGLG